MEEEKQSQDTENLDEDSKEVDSEESTNEEDSKATDEDSRTPQKGEEDKVSELVKKLSIAERKLKRYEKSSKDEPNKTNEANYLTKEEARLMFQMQLDEEVIEEAKIVAKGKGIPLDEAIETPAIKAFIAEKKKAEKSKKAQLDASGSVSSKIEGFKPGMSKEEHKKLWEKYNK